MTNEDDQQEAMEPVSFVRDIDCAPDPILTEIVVTSNQVEGSSFLLTLHVSGLVVSGTLIGSGRFFDEMAVMLERVGQVDFAETFARPNAELMREEAAQEGDSYQPQFIHLTNARVFTSPGSRPLPPTLWRGRLSHVSAWSLGSFDTR
jgi:hypothetical protein